MEGDTKHVCGPVPEPGECSSEPYVNRTPRRYDIYIGSDNQTHRQNEDYVSKVLEWAGRIFPNGYTIVHGEGYFGQSKEDSLVVSAIVERELELSCDMRALKRLLNQDAILVTKCAVEAEMV